MGLFGRLRTEPVYNTRAVVQRTGVPADTFRAWERRYGLPAPARTAGNQRLYSDRDIATIAWLRDQTRAGLTISQAVRLYQSRGPAGVSSGATEAAPVSGTATGDDSAHADSLAVFQQEVVEALVRYDAVAATRVVEEALALVPVEEVCLRILQPALYEIGNRWERGEIGVSAEHFASGFVVRKLGALFNLSQPEHGRGPILAACLEGELHDVGLLLTSLFLSRRGFHILYLGPNLPLADLIQAIDRVRPRLVLLSASTPETALDLATAVRELSGRCAALRGFQGWAPVLGFGGRIFVERPELQTGIDGVFLGRDAGEAAGTVDRVLAAAAA